MSGANEPPKDPELDEAVLRVPYWRALGLGLAGIIAALPVLLYLANRDRDASVLTDDSWLDGSTWRIVEIERRMLAREGAMTFRNGRLMLEVEGCTTREVPYRLTPTGIALSLPALAATPADCSHPAMEQTWARLPHVAGLTRYATGLALTDKAGRDLVRMRR